MFIYAYTKRRDKTFFAHGGAEAESTGLGTTPVVMLETSKGLPPPLTAPARRSLIMSLQTGPLGADEPAGGFPC